MTEEPNWAKLLRMDFITYTNKVEHEIKMVKKEMRGIKESLTILINKRPDEWLKKAINQIKEELTENRNIIGLEEKCETLQDVNNILRKEIKELRRKK